MSDNHESVTYKSNKKWTEEAHKYCSKMLPIFYMDFFLPKMKRLSLIPHLAHFCYYEVCPESNSVYKTNEV